MMRIRVDGVHFNVEQTGDGPSLLLLHGFTGSCDTWSTFVSSLGRHFRMIAVDLPGHGHSDTPADPQRNRDLLALLDWLGMDRISLLGYSMGGRIALHLALAAPDRIRALVLESASPGMPDPADRAARRKADEDLALVLEHEGLETFVDRWERQSLFASQARLPGSASATTLLDWLRASEALELVYRSRFGNSCRRCTNRPSSSPARTTPNIGR
jgi:2-succinyl-6-hydroxy-2,4-cyclohexadiene-1-carboxylate synthase